MLSRILTCIITFSKGIHGPEVLRGNVLESELVTWRLRGISSRLRGIRSVHIGVYCGMNKNPYGELSNPQSIPERACSLLPWALTTPDHWQVSLHLQTEMRASLGCCPMCLRKLTFVFVFYFCLKPLFWRMHKKWVAYIISQETILLIKDISQYSQDSYSK